MTRPLFDPPPKPVRPIFAPPLVVGYQPEASPPGPVKPPPTFKRKRYGGGQAGRSVGKGRIKPGEMNKTERRYAEKLEAQLRAGEIRWWRFEAFKLRLADTTFYTPDFGVMTAEGFIECHEVKGFWEDAARVKIKVAAEQYPFRFIAVTEQRKKDGGGYDIETFE